MSFDGYSMSSEQPRFNPRYAGDNMDPFSDSAEVGPDDVVPHSPRTCISVSTLHSVVEDPSDYVYLKPAPPVRAVTSFGPSSHDSYQEDTYNEEEPSEGYDQFDQSENGVQFNGQFSFDAPKLKPERHGQNSAHNPLRQLHLKKSQNMTSLGLGFQASLGRRHSRVSSGGSANSSVVSRRPSLKSTLTINPAISLDPFARRGSRQMSICLGSPTTPTVIKSPPKTPRFQSRRSSQTQLHSFKAQRKMSRVEIKEHGLPTYEESTENLNEFTNEVSKRRYSLDIMLDQMKQSIITRTVPWVWRLTLLLFVYLVIVGFPIWKGAAFSIYLILKAHHMAVCGCLFFVVGGTWLGLLPMLLSAFEADPYAENVEARDVLTTALVITAHKAAAYLPDTIEAALATFRPGQIFVVSYGIDTDEKTAAACSTYAVNHTFVSVDSKLGAKYIGCTLARDYQYVLFVDANVKIPSNIPIPTDRMGTKPNPKWYEAGLPPTACIGYSVKIAGSESTSGSLWQQAQDLEAKMTALKQTFAGDFGSATSLNSAAMLWDRKVFTGLIDKVTSPAISEDWHLAQVCRSAGYRIQYSSEVFCETTAPSNLLFRNGEQSIFANRFCRWNAFMLTRLWINIVYLLTSWRLGRLEIMTKAFIFMELYAFAVYLLTPLIIPIAFVAAPVHAAVIIGITAAVYIASILFFNIVHLRWKGESVGIVGILAYLYMTFIFAFVGVANMYYSWWMFGKYCETGHPRAQEGVMTLEAAKKCFGEIMREEEKEDFTRRVTREISMSP